MATQLQQQQFVSQYGPYATQAGAALGVSPNVVLGQWAFESNWGTSNVAQTNGNLAGLGYTGSGYSSYASPQDFTNGYISFVQNNRYSGALNTGTDSNAFVSGLKSGGYFTGDLGAYQTGVASNAATIAQINPSLTNGQIASSPANGTEGYGSTASGTPSYYEGYDQNGNFLGGTSDPQAYPIQGATTYNPVTQGNTNTTGTGTGTGTGTAATTAGSLGADVGYVPPAATGGPQATGLAPGVVSSITGWVGSVETAVGNAFKAAWSGTIGQIENLALRALIVFAAVVIIAVALWRLIDPEGEKTAQLVRSMPAPVPV